MIDQSPNLSSLNQSTMNVKTESAVKATYFGPLCVVIPRKWIEGSQLGPSCAQFLSGITIESTDIGSNQGDAEHVEIQYPLNERRTQTTATELEKKGDLTTEKVIIFNPSKILYFL